MNGRYIILAVFACWIAWHEYRIHQCWQLSVEISHHIRGVK